MRVADGIIATEAAALIQRARTRAARRLPHLLLPLLIFALAATSAAAATVPASDGWLDDLAAAHARARTENKPILVDLWAEWCTWCKRLEQDVFSTPVFKQYANGFVLLRVDTDDGAEGTRLMVDYEVESLPTTLILSPDLIKLGELQGYLPAAPYVQSLALETAMFDALVRLYEDHRRGIPMRTGGDGAGAVGDPVQNLADELYARRDGARAATLYRELLARGSDNVEELAWNHFYYADSLRLAHDLAGARQATAAAHQAVAEVDNVELKERVDLLSYYLARDAAACAEARQAIDRFIAEHPQGALLDLAREEQQRLKTVEGCA
jgi:thiol-disulfide isomerase/thioredoxin